jgi:hypothetical protein
MPICAGTVSRRPIQFCREWYVIPLSRKQHSWRFKALPSPRQGGMVVTLSRQCGMAQDLGEPGIMCRNQLQAGYFQIDSLAPNRII